MKMKELLTSAKSKLGSLYPAKSATGSSTAKQCSRVAARCGITSRSNIPQSRSARSIYSYAPHMHCRRTDRSAASNSATRHFQWRRNDSERGCAKEEKGDWPSTLSAMMLAPTTLTPRQYRCSIASMMSQPRSHVRALGQRAHPLSG